MQLNGLTNAVQPDSPFRPSLGMGDGAVLWPGLPSLQRRSGGTGTIVPKRRSSLQLERQILGAGWMRSPQRLCPAGLEVAFAGVGVEGRPMLS